MATLAELERLAAIVRTGYVKSAGKGVAQALGEAGFPIRTGQGGPVPKEVKDRLRDRLVREFGVNPDRLEPNGPRIAAAATRREALEMTADEKMGRARIRGVVILRPQPGMPVIMDGEGIRLPEGATLNIRPEDAGRIAAPGVILVENWEVFRDFGRLDFPVPFCRRRDLLVFRGMPHVSPQDAVEDFLRRLGRPVTVFPDFDPSGLANALAVPGYSGLLWPGPARLAELVRGRLGRPDLFAAQEEAARARLDRAEGAVRAAWGIVKGAGRGVVQEGMLR
ncbi:DUF7281 domain-containing protein [Defluviimonas salinarum]|uniref:DUF7281 domain-containing protein n=1 Tax=Defluviimonas salinarum TaxID=2992147 RepID=A0ABT3J9M4_9RHOB|nr:hypothetical protein [Defluviimonas salinarum]MCW3784387.1 hypothetical protein [Defluviimonas salinarum]